MKSYIIILQESEHSKKIGAESISEANKFGIYPEVHNGVLGYNAPEKFKEYGITRFLTRDIIDNPGHQGCFLSHFELWIKCVKLNEPILILEHDGVFIRELPVDILNRFDGVLKLDPFDPFLDDYENKVQNSLLETNVDVWHQEARNKWHGVGEFIWGAYGYIIKPHAALELIQFTRRIGAAPTDVHIGRNIVDIKSTRVPIVRMSKTYIDNNIKSMSSTSNLNQYIEGKNRMAFAPYLSPKKYKELIKTLEFLEEVDIN
jgi:GR25 family glycosyltransferase involved in LPS biosynthesis